MLNKLALSKASIVLKNGNLANLEYINSDQLDELFALELRSHNYPWRRENFQSSFGIHHCVGLRSGDQWIAYAVLSLVAGEAELLLFVVDREYQNQGIGKQFLQLLLGGIQAAANALFLEVRSSNSPAIAVYEALGFNQVGLRPGYYPGGRNGKEDALIYAVELSAWQPDSI
jgi:[ribosomal protein S18]-alanine N-acetyltransferase